MQDDSLAEFLRGRAPPVFQDDVAPRRMTKLVDSSRGSTSSFVLGGAPVLADTASELNQGHKKLYQGHAAQGGGWQQAARDPSMYQTVAKGGQVADADRHALHANGTRKFSTKRMVVPAVTAAQNYHTRFLGAQPSASGLSSVDRRIASFAGSFAGLAPPK